MSLLNLLKSGWQSWATLGAVIAFAAIHSAFIKDFYPLPVSALMGGVFSATVISLISRKRQRSDQVAEVGLRVSRRVDDFKPLIHPTMRRSVFWNNAFANQITKPSTAWVWFKDEKYVNIAVEVVTIENQLLKAQKEQRLEEISDAFIRLCITAQNLGAFIDRLGQYFKTGSDSAMMDSAAQSWFNDIVLTEYNNFVDRLKFDQRELQPALGNTIEIYAAAVIKIRPVK